MKKFISVFTLALCVAVPSTGFAQFGTFLQQLGGLAGTANTPASGGAAASAGAPSSSLLATYVAANKDILYANAFFAESMGLKEQAAIAKATADALTEGSTKDVLEESNKVITSSSAALDEAIKKSPRLDQRSQNLYGQGLARFGLGMIKYASLKGQTVSMAGGGVSSIFSNLAGAQTTIFIVSSLPQSTINLASTLKNMTTFARDNNIKVPDDATKALAAL